ncbi:MAG: ABC transporter substrate-binding protein, partial [Gammaproteobacteria bacterium]|nr:ABC transporter substrate-binding protein [Gammaproteobacteria bacterium]
FTVKIKIPKVDPVVMEKIRVGMTAKFEIDIRGKPRIMLPVTAVSQQNGNSVVTALNAQGVQKIVPVITGDTTPTEVVIISGVNVGDRVLVP